MSRSLTCLKYLGPSIKNVDCGGCRTWTCKGLLPLVFETSAIPLGEPSVKLLYNFKLTLAPIKQKPPSAGEGVVGCGGIEPPARWLKASCSTAELTTHKRVSAGDRTRTGTPLRTENFKSSLSASSSTAAQEGWCRGRDSNPQRPYGLPNFKSGALPVSLPRHEERVVNFLKRACPNPRKELVGPAGFEPATNRLWAGSSNRWATGPPY